MYRLGVEKVQISSLKGTVPATSCCIPKCTILNPLFPVYVPSRSLCSTCERCFIVSSHRGTKSLSQTFKWNVRSWWNDLPNSIRAAKSLAIFTNSLPSLFDPLTLARSIIILFLKNSNPIAFLIYLFYFCIFVSVFFFIYYTNNKNKKGL